MDGKSQNRLLQAAIAGDHTALARLLVSNSPTLTKRIGDRLRFNPFADFGVEDVLQEVFVDVTQGIGSFRPDQGTPFGAWLSKVADNRLAKMLQRRKRKKRGGDLKQQHGAGAVHDSVKQLVEVIGDAKGGTPSEFVVRDELIEAVREQIEALPSAQRAAVNTYFIDDRSLESTAQAIDKPPAAVRGLIHRAKRGLRTAMGNSTRWFKKK